ncbi:MAG: DUF1330 domain-containing protein [Gammaproteobacteria bacterium]|nr:DUF1330 domain-containing protein [Gammaproteobacteria bacterium]
MAGYWIIRGNLKDQAALEAYAAAFQPLGQRYRVKIIAGRGQSKTVEGPGFDRQLVIRFDSYADALACYEDPEYQALLPLVQRAQERELVIVEGETD